MALSSLNDPERLSANQRSLLESMEEKVMLVAPDGTVEYLNPAAAEIFGDLSSGAGRSTTEGTELLQLLARHDQDGAEPAGLSAPVQVKIGSRGYELSLAPFLGYRGDHLRWAFLRPLASRRESRIPSPRPLSPNDTAMIGSSQAIAEFKRTLRLAAVSDSTVLLSGESGTGKDLAARLIHLHSSRRHKPFLTINCNSINDSLLESELFGYEKGAFTGAQKQKKGKFEAVHQGTLFLNEIGDITPRMQAALLHVLENGEIIRVGGNHPLRVDVRIIAATNKQLSEEVRRGTFRLDLYYRLNILNMELPPLRRRREDLPELAAHFLEKHCRLASRKLGLEPGLIEEQLADYDWPGNVRELENLIQRAVLMSRTDTITAQDLGFSPTGKWFGSTENHAYPRRWNGIPLKEIVALVEKDTIERRLSSCNGDVAQAAAALHICRAALYEKMRKYGISAREIRKG